MKLEFDSGKTLRDLLQCCGGMAEQAMLVVTDKGLTIYAMNETHTTFVTAWFPVEFFVSYDVKPDESLKIVLNLQTHARLIRRIPTAGSAILGYRIDQNRLIILSSKPYTKIFSLTTETTTESDQFPEMKIESFLADVNMSSETFSTIVESGEDVHASDIQLIAKTGKFASMAKGDLMTAESEAEEFVTVKLTDGQEITSSFALKLLGEVMSFITAFASDEIRLRLNNNYPIRVEIPIKPQGTEYANLQSGKVTCVLAPIRPEEKVKPKRKRPEAPKKPAEPKTEVTTALAVTAPPELEKCTMCANPLKGPPYMRKTEGDTEMVWCSRKCYDEYKAALSGLEKKVEENVEKTNIE